MTLKELIVTRFKEAGLEMLEDNAMKSIDVTLDILEEVVKLTENKIDDLVLPFVPKVRSVLKELADKINVEDNA